MSALSAQQASSVTPRARPAAPLDLVIVAVTVGVLTICGMQLAQRAGRVGTFWPANGCFLAILLSSRSHKLPAYMAVGFLANLAGALLSAFPVEVCLRLAVVNTLEVTLGLTLVRRWIGVDCDLSQPPILWRFALAAAVLAPALAALLNALLAAMSADPRAPQALMASFLAHVLGIVTTTPLVLGLRRHGLSPRCDRRKAMDIAVSYAVLLGMTALVFLQSRYPLLFMIFPPLVLVVFRCGVLGGVFGLFLAILLSIGLTVGGVGPTVMIAQASAVERILVVQLFAVVAAGLVLSLSAILAERDRAVQDLVKAKNDLTRLAATDGLTGLPNRRRMDEALAEECRRAARGGVPLSVLLIDVDRFKAFNDHYGHLAGDACLRTIASTIRTFARRPGDLAARYGGEEFAFVLPATPEHGALALAEAVRAAVADLALPHRGNTACGGVVTISIGIATAAPQAQSAYRPEALISAADELLYEAKRTGRNKVLSAGSRPSDPVPAPLADEERRLRAVETYRLAAKGGSAELDEVARRAAALLGSPIGLVSLVGRDNQVFVGRHGFDRPGTSRSVSFCAHTITADDPMVVPDATKDPRFRDNALVAGDLNLRFYAGAPLVTLESSHHIGALCVLDNVPHAPLNAGQRDELASLADLAMRSLETLTAEKDAAASDKRRVGINVFGRAGKPDAVEAEHAASNDRFRTIRPDPLG